MTGHYHYIPLSISGEISWGLYSHVHQNRSADINTGPCSLQQRRLVAAGHVQTIKVASRDSHRIPMTSNPKVSRRFRTTLKAIQSPSNPSKLYEVIIQKFNPWSRPYPPNEWPTRMTFTLRLDLEPAILAWACHAPKQSSAVGRSLESETQLLCGQDTDNKAQCITRTTELNAVFISGRLRTTRRAEFIQTLESTWSRCESNILSLFHIFHHVWISW